MWVIGVILYIWLVDFVSRSCLNFSPIDFIKHLFNRTPSLSLKEKIRLQELEKAEIDRKIKKLEE